MSALDRAECIYAVHSRDIDRAERDFGDHPGITKGKIIRWMSNFSDEDLGLAVKILREIRYYSASNIWSMTRELVKIVRAEFVSVPWDKVIFVPIGPPYSGAMAIARVLRDTREVPQENIKHMTELEKMNPVAIGAFVFVDDFSGTGDSLSEWWPLAESIVMPKGVPFAIGLLVLNASARSAIKKFAEKVYCIDELEETDNVLSPNSSRFTHEEKDRLAQYCQRTQCRSHLVHGYGRCGLLLAFRHGCPNNSLPILWQKSPAWEPIFKRSDA